MSETIYEAHILITPFLELRKLRLNDHCNVVAFNLGCKLASLGGIFLKNIMLHPENLIGLEPQPSTLDGFAYLPLGSYLAMSRDIFGCTDGTSRVQSLFLNGQKRQCSLVTTETHPASNVNRSRVNPRCVRGNGRHQGNCLPVTEGLTHYDLKDRSKSSGVTVLRREVDMIPQFLIQEEY